MTQPEPATQLERPELVDDQQVGAAGEAAVELVPAPAHRLADERPGEAAGHPAADRLALVDAHVVGEPPALAGAQVEHGLDDAPGA